MTYPPRAREIDGSGREWAHFHIMCCAECLEIFRTPAAPQMANQILMQGTCGHNYVFTITANKTITSSVTM